MDNLLGRCISDKLPLLNTEPRILAYLNIIEAALVSRLLFAKMEWTPRLHK